MAETPWYQNGLRFECHACGDCCSGAPGYVWVNQQEIADLAQAIDLSVEEFECKYVRKVGIRKSLVEYEGGDCVFLDAQQRRCTVYSARPRQCRTWPFWNSNLRTPEAWQETCDVCPGSGQGKLYQLEEIERRAEVMKL